MTSKPARSSAALWESLIARGDIQPKSYDQALVNEILRNLGLTKDRSLTDALADIPIERFIQAFFEASQPFVEMWQDLLALFQRAAASTGSEQLEISYDFSADRPNVRFRLENFRHIISRAQRIMAHFDLSECTPSDLWQVSAVYQGDRDIYKEHAPWNQDVERFIRACMEEDYPIQMPTRPTTTDTRLDALVDETWALGALILRDLGNVFGGYRNVHESSRQEHVLLSGISLSTLRDTESNHWLPSLVTSVTARLAHVEQPSVPLTEALNTALERLRNHDPELTTPQQRLEELLSLPLWKHRYDLYSNWVTTQVIAGLEDQKPLVHSAKGRIDFSFKGTHLATFELPMPRIHLWTEYKTPLKNPVGEGRKAAIQPDITLRRDPLTADNTPLVVECKQYRNAKTQWFADALIDYARGHRDAVVVLVNYGGGRESAVLSKVAPDVKDRTVYIVNLKPNSADSLNRFRDVVRASIRLAGIAMTINDDPI